MIILSDRLLLVGCLALCIFVIGLTVVFGALALIIMKVLWWFGFLGTIWFFLIPGSALAVSYTILHWYYRKKDAL